MSYTKTEWQNNATALSADNMDHIEQGLFDAHQVLDGIMNAIYPVGSIYMSATLSTHQQVEALFGGTWEAWGSGRVPVGVDTTQTEFETVGKSGGDKSHTHSNPATGGSSAANTGGTALSVANLPSHSHSIPQHTHPMEHNHGTGSTAGYDNFVTASGDVGNDSGSALAGSGYTFPRANSSNGFNVRTKTGQSSASATGLGGSGGTGNTGSGTAHSHSMAHTHTVGATDSGSTLQPYITCFMYKRTA